MVLGVVAEEVVAQTAAMDVVLCLLGNVGHVRRLLHQVAATAELVDAMVFQGQARVGAQAQEGVEAKGLVLHAGQFRVAVPVVVIFVAAAYLSIQEDAGLAVVRYQRGVGRGNVLKR